MTQWGPRFFALCAGELCNPQVELPIRKIFMPCRSSFRPLYLFSITNGLWSAIGGLPLTALQFQLVEHRWRAFHFGVTIRAVSMHWPTWSENSCTSRAGCRLKYEVNPPTVSRTPPPLRPPAISWRFPQVYGLNNSVGCGGNLRGSFGQTALAMCVICVVSTQQLSGLSPIALEW